MKQKPLTDLQRAIDALQRIAATERRNLNANNRLKVIYAIADDALANLPVQRSTDASFGTTSRS